MISKLFLSRIVTCPVCRGEMQWKDKNTMICSCGYEIKVKRTNADIIRIMTNEELVKLFLAIQGDILNNYHGGLQLKPIFPTTKETWLKWLGKESEGEDG